MPLNLRTFQRPSRSSALQRPSRSADMLSGNAAQSTHVSAAEPLKRHAQRQRRSVYVVFSGRAAQPCAFGQTSAAAPLSNLLAWRSLSFLLREQMFLLSRRVFFLLIQFFFAAWMSPKKKKIPRSLHALLGVLSEG